MKRVFALILCLAFCVLMVASCAPTEEHVHTYDTTWSKDAGSHWYAPNCGCEDAPRIMEFSHADGNNDGACDVCTYTDHTHTYAEEWTIDCTNHWNAADCGHTVAGANVAAHVDESNDGKCDVCGYVINDIHNHYYSSEWTSDETNHWHAPLCEHTTELKDVAPHELNDAGDCTVCGKKVKDVDMTDILAVLKAAVANNYKVVTGDIVHGQLVYDGSESNNSLVLSNAATDGIYFVLGNDQSYIFMKDYNASGTLIGGEQQWFERISEDNIFGVKMDVNSYTLDRVDGVPAKLNGYNYMPGDLLMAGYDDTSTLAQTLYDMYDIMVKGVNVSDVVSGYDADSDKYVFAYNYYTVNEITSAGVVTDRVLLYYEVAVTFSVNDDLIIELADFYVKQYAYTNGGETENDLVYDEETGVVSKGPNANPTCYVYEVYQTSGERTFTTPYPKASLIPTDFNFYHVTDYEYPTSTEWVVYDETLIGDTLTVNSGDYVYFRLGDPTPSTSSFNFIDTSDFTFEFVNNDSGSAAEAWYMTPGSTDAMINGYSQYIGCLKLKMRDPGEYTMTIALGGLTKTITLTILGEAQPEISGDADSIDVLLTDFNSYDTENQSYTYVADAEGNYTFTVPAGLGVRIDGEDVPKVNLYSTTGGSFTVGLNAGESVKLYFATYDATRYTVDVSYEAADIPDPDVGGGDEGDDTVGDISGVYDAKAGINTGVLTINADGTMTFAYKTYTLNYTYTISGGNVVLTNDYGVISDSAALYSGGLKLEDGVPSVFTYNGYNYALTKQAAEDDVTLEGSGTENDPYVLPKAGDYVCAFPGQSDVVWYTYTVKTSGYVTVSTTFGQDGWIKLGTSLMTYVSNEGNGEPYEIYYPAGTVLYIGIGNYAESAVDVPFTVAERAVTSDPITNVVGTWYGTGTTMFATVDYTLTINADGTGTLVYNDFGSDVSCTLTYVLVEGEKVTVGYVGGYTEGFLVCTYVADVFTCTAGIYGESFTFSTTPPAEGGDEEEGEKVYAGGTVVVGENTVVVTDDDKTAGEFTLIFEAPHTTEYKFTSGALYVSAVTGPDGAVTKDADNYWYSLVEGTKYTLTINTILVSAAGDEDLNITEPNWEAEAEDVTAKVVGSYVANGYNVMVFANNDIEPAAGDYLAWIYDDNMNVSLYYTVVATADGDGAYVLNLTYVSRPDYEAGAEQATTIGEMLFIVTPGEEEPATTEDSVVGWYEEALNGNNIMLYNDTDSGVYYFNVFNDSELDLYYSYVATDNGDGTVSLALTFAPDYWASLSTTDTLGLDGKVVVATSAGDSWTFALEGEGSGEEEPAAPSGTFADPFALGENNSCEFPGGYDYTFYKFTAQVAGTLTVTMTSDDFFWAYGAGEYALETVGSSQATKDIALASGESVWIGISTNSTEAGTVTFTASFATGEDSGEVEPAEQGTFANPYELAEDNTCEFPGGMGYVFYSYTATEDGNLTITVTSSDFYWCYGYSEATLENVGNVATATLPVEADQTIYIGMATYSCEVGTVTFTASFATGENSGEVTVNETPMILGNNSVNGSDINFAYTAESDIVLNVQVGNALGTVTVTYSIDGATAIAIANGTSVEVTLTAGQKLVVSAVTSGGYMTITVSEVAQETGPDGSSSDPYVIETLPTEITHTGKHDKYYIYTATEDIVLTITAPAGCYVTNDAGATAVNGVYTITLAAGESVSLNVWTNSTDETNYVYTITGAAPVVDGGDEEGGESTDIDGTYVGVGTNSRGMKFIIDTEADTLVIIRAQSGTLDDFADMPSYTYTYSTTLEKAANGETISTVDGTWSPVSSITFDENGVPTSITATAIYSNFVKQ